MGDFVLARAWSFSPIQFGSCFRPRRRPGGDETYPMVKLKFYGGKTNPMEKRTRVRARVISHALKELIVESDKVIVMGHKYPDMDAIGASIGIRKAAEMNHREGYIVLDFADIDTGVKRLMEEVKAYPDLYSQFIITRRGTGADNREYTPCRC